MALLIPDVVHVYHHIVFDGSTVAKLNTILERTEQIMADTQATLAKLAAATESLAGIRQDITDLKALIAAGGTPQEVSDAVDALSAAMAGLDSENPAPPVP